MAARWISIASIVCLLKTKETGDLEIYRFTSYLNLAALQIPSFIIKISIISDHVKYQKILKSRLYKPFQIWKFEIHRRKFYFSLPNKLIWSLKSGGKFSYN